MNTNAHFNKNGNIKLGGNMWSFSKLCTDQAFYIKSLKQCVVGSCGGYCNGCRKDCYARKSYRYGSVLQCHAINTIAMREDMTKAFYDLQRQIDLARNKPSIIRIHQSGELETKQEFCNWVEMARINPNITFYLYTKAYDIVLPIVLNDKMPDNLIVNFSVWHEYGYQEYKQAAHVPTIKAFVYDDGYAYPFEMGTYCKAYGDNGKLNHNITCEKCRKCFDNNVNHKIIGCKAH